MEQSINWKAQDTNKTEINLGKFIHNQIRDDLHNYLIFLQENGMNNMEKNLLIWL